MSIEKASLVSIREAVPADRAFILATWLRSIYYGDNFFSQIPKDRFMKHYHKLIERFIDNPIALVQVVCLKDDPEVILGYSVAHTTAEGVALDWVYVKKPWRGIGIARSLIPQGVASVSHLTKVGASLLPKLPKVVFDPFS